MLRIELTMDCESQHETKLESLRQRFLSDIGTDNAGVRAGHRFRKIDHAARELTEGRIRYTGSQPHQYDVNEHCDRGSRFVSYSRPRNARSTSRLACRSASAVRLSYSFLPRATPISSLANPFFK